MSLPKQTNIAIVGAGPHALTLVTHLLQKREKYRHKIIVFDPSGTWMSQWRQQFAAQDIPHLRSPVVHHPDPDPYSLRRFAENRPNELFPPYDLPGTKVFQEFSQDVVSRWQLEDKVYKASVTNIAPITYRGKPNFRVELDDGNSTIARQVVIANGGGKPQLPEWAKKISTPYPNESLCHSHEVDLQGLRLRGEKVLIIGGGLTSGHLALGALKRGANVALMLRRKLKEKLFDADAGWLGPKYLKGFSAETDWQKRWQLIQQARDGGSVTPEVMTQLRRYQHQDELSIFEECQVVGAEFVGDRWQVKCDDGMMWEGDRIWLATGTKLDVTQQPILKEVLHTHPVKIVNGLPVLDEYLCWSGCKLFIMGGLAALQVGPVARNLSGARMASSRIVSALKN
ncbi:MULTISPECIES: FAD/NAD(P)-binding protein [Okeania]|uniref:FAD-dependent oxidoreductase n=1 Tax=Okeania hirsuta TaxID=1458930 RepID=A0A3N6Q279_9CYAN|nr:MULTISPECIES: FAD/NAD(P)-binding protein [Okeania]NET11682.1 lysine N(6)-hydroxylase/L-ornithine N(5)-oxygenase family protein [Okeania sp. SIO1H6]NES76190.1 lysine N(6)-hydroxylase/L-ornithine N(5)-oxygenase family protein [Okeania sp. SIO1H4]NES87805.1 lysine N(6)-hydroxylase/L-ornithine N(5)-oxygenase family protein [Okeania sp. SIO2B9]NET19476.1 lysine N(6)-hydroxylase/L-ornithine N(5)-oxygenase family protein [Okeania sp. SIO1H5]NET76572.1 lysine N(6)-hydroxylase/L-ornithine N(5)-oxyge